MSGDASSTGRAVGEKKVDDEEILNVFRRSSEPFLKTAAVAEEIAIGQRATQKRLNELEDEGRVDSEPVGQARVWFLDEDEPQDVVEPEIARELRIGNLLGNWAERFRRITLWFFGLGGFLMLVIVATNMEQSAIPMASTDQVILLAFWAAFAGAAALFFWSVSLFLSNAIPAIARQQVD